MIWHQDVLLLQRFFLFFSLWQLWTFHRDDYIWLRKLHKPLPKSPLAQPLSTLQVLLLFYQIKLAICLREQQKQHLPGHLFNSAGFPLKAQLFNWSVLSHKNLLIFQISVASLRSFLCLGWLRDTKQKSHWGNWVALSKLVPSWCKACLCHLLSYRPWRWIFMSQLISDPTSLWIDLTQRRWCGFFFARLLARGIERYTSASKKWDWENNRVQNNKTQCAWFSHNLQVKRCQTCTFIKFVYMTTAVISQCLFTELWSLLIGASRTVFSHWKSQASLFLMNG